MLGAALGLMQQVAGQPVEVHGRIAYVPQVCVLCLFNPRVQFNFCFIGALAKILRSQHRCLCRRSKHVDSIRVLEHDTRGLLSLMSRGLCRGHFKLIFIARDDRCSRSSPGLWNGLHLCGQSQVLLHEVCR